MERGKTWLGPQLSLRVALRVDVALALYKPEPIAKSIV